MRHDGNRGIAAAYNTFVSEGRGELIAMIGDDDACLPGRVRRQVEMFDRFPDTGVVHGDAVIIDSAGVQTGVWPSAEFTPSALVQSFFRSHNHIVDPTRMVHRRVYEAVGGYDDRYPLANDFDFCLRAAAGSASVTSPAARSWRSAATARTPRMSRRARASRSTSSGRSRPRWSATPCASSFPSSTGRCSTPPTPNARRSEHLADALEARLLPVPGLAAKLRDRPRRRPSASHRFSAATARGC